MIYRIVATVLSDVHIDIEAESAEEALARAEEIDGGEWIDEGTGEFQISTDVIEMLPEFGSIRKESL